MIYTGIGVKLIQRFGRIDRIGSEKEVIYGYNFLPELGIEKHLGLQQKLRNRIQEIHDTIGEDAAILDRTEQLNEETMYAIYEPNGKQLSLFDPEDEAEFFDLNEAEEILRKLQKENPDEYGRITNLPHGIRTAKNSFQKGLYVFCEASDPNRPHLKGYQQLFLIDQKGDIISRDIPRILATIKADSAHPADFPKDYNSAVMKVKHHFAQEVKHRQAEREYQQRLTQGQRYIIRELRILFKVTPEESLKTQINILEKVFRSPLTQTINEDTDAERVRHREMSVRELNILRRNSITGEDLLKQLIFIYNQHQMREWLNDRRLSPLSHPVPQIICSEALT